jgi:hypothetical protein
MKTLPDSVQVVTVKDVYWELGTKDTIHIEVQRNRDPEICLAKLKLLIGKSVKIDGSANLVLEGPVTYAPPVLNLPKSIQLPTKLGVTELEEALKEI